MCFAQNKISSVNATGSLLVKRKRALISLICFHFYKCALSIINYVFTCILEKTQIKPGSGPVDYEVKAGDPATFRCSAQKDDSLDLFIDWQRNGQLIDFESEPRFVRTNDYSLTITKTNELDSGIYTCIASTRLDNDTAQATLIVQDIPFAPKLLSVVCNALSASVRWQPMGDNRAPILSYIIQYNTTFTPDTWDVAFDTVRASEVNYDVSACSHVSAKLFHEMLSYRFSLHLTRR